MGIPFRVTLNKLQHKEVDVILCPPHPSSYFSYRTALVPEELGGFLVGPVELWEPSVYGGSAVADLLGCCLPGKAAEVTVVHRI